jgi:hypothetical protein
MPDGEAACQAEAGCAVGQGFRIQGEHRMNYSLR